MFFVYVLYSDNFDKFYVGLSQNVEKRLVEHNKGQTKSTKPYLPWRVVHFKEFDTRKEGRKREKYLKIAAGRRWRNDNIKLGD